MQKRREWGEFFPAELAPFPYNLTHAQDFLPLNREQAEKLGYSWFDEPPKQGREAEFTSPDTIEGVDESVLGMVLRCEESAANFKIQKGELAFYRKLDLPLPSHAPNERFNQRLKLRNKRSFSQRPCSKCGKEIWSSISSDDGLEVLCEEDFSRVCE
jgi:hypothetical protein